MITVNIHLKPRCSTQVILQIRWKIKNLIDAGTLTHVFLWYPIISVCTIKSWHSVSYWEYCIVWRIRQFANNSNSTFPPIPPIITTCQKKNEGKKNISVPERLTAVDFKKCICSLILTKHGEFWDPFIYLFNLLSTVPLSRSSLWFQEVVSHKRPDCSRNTFELRFPKGYHSPPRAMSISQKILIFHITQLDYSTYAI